MKILIFDIWGDHGHFKVPYTTTSPLTHPVPSKTALYGIISAIMGYDKRNYLNYFQNKSWLFGIGIRNPVTKTHISENLINSKVAKMFSRMEKGKSCRTQIRFEFLKEPCFRIYVHTKDAEKINLLESFLMSHKSTYTLSLGLSECLANYNFVGSFQAIQKCENKKFIELHSILPLHMINDSSQLEILKEDRKYIKTHLPLEMKPDRELIESGDFLIEANGKPISVSLESYIEISELSENVILF